MRRGTNFEMMLGQRHSNNGGPALNQHWLKPRLIYDTFKI